MENRAVRNKQIAAINIGKKALGMDDDVYRQMLNNVTGKSSLKMLNDSQLSQVLEHMKKTLGFKPQAKKQKAKPRPRALAVNKIRAIWITMYKQGFIENGSDDALDAYARRMTKTSNIEGVASINWVDNKQASQILESIKRWHYRLMKKALEANNHAVETENYEKLTVRYLATTKQDKI